MKAIHLYLVLAMVSFFSCKEKEEIVDEVKPPVVTDLKCTSKQSFAVVELFTSQGCSSCPAVDNIINGYVKKDTGLNILYLSQHIDYWNGALNGPCGVSAWIDPFSHSRYTDRQKVYRTSLGMPGLITPQIIFSGVIGTYNNGAGTVPFNTTAIRNKIDEQLALPANSGIAIKMKQLKESEKSIEIEYATLDLPANCKLVVFLLESGLSKKITAGENCNKTLSHENVSRAFVEIDNPGEHGFIEVKWNDDVVIANSRIVAIITNKDNQTIAAGTKGFKLVE